MTLTSIRYTYDVGFKLSKEGLMRLVKHTLPELRYTARADAAEHYDLNPDMLDQVQIETYLATQHEYDVVDISRIVEAIKRVEADMQ
jgi:hypothetical protein